MNIRFYRQILENFMKIHPVGVQSFHVDGGLDREM
jgi:hypothetical protein